MQYLLHEDGRLIIDDGCGKLMISFLLGNFVQYFNLENVHE